MSQKDGSCPSNESLIDLQNAVVYGTLSPSEALNFVSDYIILPGCDPDPAVINLLFSVATVLGRNEDAIVSPLDTECEVVLKQPGFQCSRAVNDISGNTFIAGNVTTTSLIAHPVSITQEGLPNVRIMLEESELSESKVLVVSYNNSWFICTFGEVEQKGIRWEDFSDEVKTSFRQRYLLALDHIVSKLRENVS